MGGDPKGMLLGCSHSIELTCEDRDTVFEILHF